MDTSRKVEGVRLLHVAHDPNGKKVLEFKLEPPFESFELHQLGIMANGGAHLYPWSVIERVDFEGARAAAQPDPDEALDTAPAIPVESTAITSAPVETPESAPKRSRKKPGGRRKNQPS